MNQQPEAADSFIDNCDNGGNEQAVREVGQVLERAVRRIDNHLRRHGLLDAVGPDAELQDPQDQLAASAVSGQAPPAGPQWRRGLSPLSAAALGYDKPLCASLDGFTLHAATRAGALDLAGREKLLRYVLRPPIAQERLEHRPDGSSYGCNFADNTFTDQERDRGLPETRMAVEACRI